MKKYKFKKERDNDSGKIYLILDFAGGDADTQHPEEVLLEDVYNGEKELSLSVKSEVLISQYQVLKKILDGRDNKYSEVLEEYGEEIAKLYDNTPNDPQCDYQFKCYLSSMSLKAYDKEGNEFQAYI